MYIVKIYDLAVKGKYRIQKADGEWIEEDVVRLIVMEDVCCNLCGEKMRERDTVIRTANVYADKTVTDPSLAWNIAILNTEKGLREYEHIENVTLEKVYFRVPVYLCRTCLETAVDENGTRRHTAYHRALPDFLQPQWVTGIQAVCDIALDVGLGVVYGSPKRRARALARLAVIYANRRKEMKKRGKEIETGKFGKDELCERIARSISSVCEVFGIYTIDRSLISHLPRGKIALDDFKRLVAEQGDEFAYEEQDQGERGADGAG
ncbi:MAG: hypothetical protein LUD72_04990 [Bacteroidales bacterium]|nr:hypothetical protein [Bacteroidales bacterium]